MKKFLKKYKHTTSLFAIVLLSVGLVALHIIPVAGILLIVASWQLLQLARSKRHAVLFNTVLSPEQIKEFGDICADLAPLKDYIPGLKELSGVEGGFAAIKQLPALLKTEKDRNDELHGKLSKLSKRITTDENRIRKNSYGFWEVSEACANHLGSMFAIAGIQQGKIAGTLGEKLLVKACDFLGMESKTAIATTDIPLPVAYANQISELVYQYGTARNVCKVYPLSGNSMKLPRLKAGEPQFAFIAISGAVPEKVPQSEFITFTPGKAGGIIRIPSEIEEDSIFDLGQFVARYIAREMAYWEDYCLFLGDGTTTYNSIQGVGKQATTDSNVYQIPTTNTHPSDITLLQCRTLRTNVTGAVLKTSKYFAHPSMEALFVTFNTSATVTPYVRNGQTAMLDGFEIVWTPIMPVYTTSATVSAYQLAFGDLSWWYLGLRRGLDVQTSRDVYFATDEVGVRALERFDIHAMGLKSTTALQLAAS